MCMLDIVLAQSLLISIGAFEKCLTGAVYFVIHLLPNTLAHRFPIVKVA